MATLGMRSSPCRRDGSPGSTGSADAGFTVIEMVIALTIMAFAFMTLASVQFGGLKALAASRQRSAFLELATAEMENLRSLPAALVGVSDNDADRLSAYPGGMHNGEPAVVLTGTTSPPVPAAVQEVTTSDVKGIVLPYTVRRWVTKDPGQDPAATQQDLRRLEIQIEWSENARVPRKLNLTSVWYPGGNGTDPPVNNDPVISPAVAPATNPSVSPSSGPPGTVFSFTANAYDPDADGLTFNWQFGDNTTGAGSSTTHQYAATGNYSVLLTVADTRGGRTTASLNVPVTTAVNTAPTAAFAFTSPTNGSSPLTVNVDGGASSDPDGDPLTWSWNWGDGTASTGPSASPSAGHVYSAAGSYTVTLTVTDTSGAFASVAGADTVSVNAGCVIRPNSASFKNPGDNAIANDIRVVSTNSPKPVNSQFVFFATTNLECGSLTWSLQTANTSQRYEVTGSHTTVGGDKVWTATSTIPNSYRFPLGAQLTGFATASGASVSFGFNAHV